MTHTEVIFNGLRGNDTEPDDAQFRAPTLVDRLFSKIAAVELPAKEHFASYLRYKVRANHKRNTIEGSFTSILLFLMFYGALGKTGSERSAAVRSGDLHRARAGSRDAHHDGEDAHGVHRRLSPFSHGAGAHPRQCAEEKNQIQTSRSTPPRDASRRCEEASLDHRPYTRPCVDTFSSCGPVYGSVKH